MGRARDIANVLTTIQNIDVSSSLDSRIYINSASPTSGNTDGRIWIDTSTASAPVLQTYGAGLFRATIVNRTKALGGNITQFGGYTIHTFLASSTFTALELLNVEVLVVAGGGGAGYYGNAGGGGAGGVLSGTKTVIGTKTITVGSGGAGTKGSAGAGTTGANSTFDDAISNGGGGGGGEGSLN